MLVKLPPEPKPIAEIEAMYPDHWILIDQPIKNELKEIESGILVMAHPSLEIVCNHCAEVGLKSFAMRCTKKSPGLRFLL